MFQPSGAGYFVPTMPQAQAQQRFFTPAQMAQVRASPRWQPPQQVRPQAAQAAAGMTNSSMSYPRFRTQLEKPAS